MSFIKKTILLASCCAVFTVGASWLAGEASAQSIRIEAHGGGVHWGSGGVPWGDSGGYVRRGYRGHRYYRGGRVWHDTRQRDWHAGSWVRYGGHCDWQPGYWDPHYMGYGSGYRHHPRH